MSPGSQGQSLYSNGVPMALTVLTCLSFPSSHSQFISILEPYSVSR